MTDRELIAHLEKKLDKQRNELARLNQLVDKLQKDKAKLLSDLKWLRGETTT